VTTQGGTPDDRGASPGLGAIGRRLDQGRPSEGALLPWLWGGIQRDGLSFLISLLVCWGGLWMLPLAVATGALWGTFSFLLALVLGDAAAWVPQGLLPTAQAGGLLAAGVAGALGGLVLLPGGATYGLATDPLLYVTAFAGRLLPGLLLALALVAGAVVFERGLLELRGARRMSRREAERIGPLASEVYESYGLEGAPTILIADRSGLAASAGARHVVLDRPLLDQLEDDELSGVLAHEVHHWRRADDVGLAFVTCCALPVILVYNALAFVARLHPVVTVLVWAFGWTFWVAVRLLIAPVVGIFSRRHEYEADAAASRAGFGEGLHRALEQLRDIEPGRTGWSRTVAATHPPTELRLEAIEDAIGKRGEDR
jgi:Zn-dependent protease with chaperone function